MAASGLVVGRCHGAIQAALHGLRAAKSHMKIIIYPHQKKRLQNE